LIHPSYHSGPMVRPDSFIKNRGSRSFSFVMSRIYYHCLMFNTSYYDDGTCSQENASGGDKRPTPARRQGSAYSPPTHATRRFYRGIPSRSHPHRESLYGPNHLSNFAQNFLANSLRISRGFYVKTSKSPRCKPTAYHRSPSTGMAVPRRGHDRNLLFRYHRHPHRIRRYASDLS